MADVSRGRAEHGISNRQHPDFAIPWVQRVLQDPEVEFPSELPAEWGQELVTNQMVNYTLAHATGMRTRIFCRRPCREADAVNKFEHFYIVSIGAGVDGATGRAHGGFAAALMDHLLGMSAHRDGASKLPPATATLTIDYKSPIATPNVLLARAWMTEMRGRKIWLRGELTDGEGKVYVTAKALFLNVRDVERAAL